MLVLNGNQKGYTHMHNGLVTHLAALASLLDSFDDPERLSRDASVWTQVSTLQGHIEKQQLHYMGRYIRNTNTKSWAPY